MSEYAYDFGLLFFRLKHAIESLDGLLNVNETKPETGESVKSRDLPEFEKWVKFRETLCDVQTEILHDWGGDIFLACCTPETETEFEKAFEEMLKII